MHDLIRRLLTLWSDGSGQDPSTPGNCLPPAALRILRAPKAIQLLSLMPLRTLNPDTPALHGWPILGRVPLADRPERERLVEQIVRGILESDGTQAMCFDPRHAIQASRGSATVDLVICYECLNVQVYLDKVRLGDALDALATTAEPVQALNDVLRRAGIPVVPPGPPWVHPPTVKPWPEEGQA